MDGIHFIDIYATKGIEYLIVIGFFMVFVLFARYLFGRSEEGEEAAAEGVARFRVPDGFFFHQGHGWLRPEAAHVGVLGLDDFAQKLVGYVNKVELPPVGASVAQGEKGWNLVIDSTPIPMLSPASGEVVAVNEAVLRNPEILREDPYGKGWLLKVKSPRIANEAHNLVSGKVALAWMENSLDKLHHIPVDHLGPLMQDGGVPVEGIARAVGGENWPEVAREHLLTSDAEQATRRFQS